VLSKNQILENEDHTRSPATRWYSQEEVTQLFETVGFRDIQLFDRFTFEKAREDSVIFSVVARKT
jgi:hypothetical protein